MSRGMNAIGASQVNRALVMRLICTNDDVTRVWLSRRMGLSRMTLTNIVNEFESKGYIMNIAELKSSDVKGRSPVKIGLADGSPIAFGVCLDGCIMRCIMMDLRSEAVLKLERVICKEADNDEIIEEVCDIFKQALRTSGRDAAGIGFVSDLSRDRTLIIARSVEKATGRRVFTGGPGIACVSCEYYYGVGREKDDFICVNIGNTTTAGLVLGGNLISGSSERAGDLSPFFGNSTNCGEAGREVIQALLGSLSGIIRFTDPSAVVIGGIHAGDPDDLEGRISSLGDNGCMPGVHVTASRFGKEMMLYGAASLVAHRIFTGELSL